MTFENLQAELERRVRGFIQDRHQWRLFVAENFERNSEEATATRIASQYRALIDKYCAPEKAHQGLALSNAPDHSPKEEHLVKFKTQGDTAIVFTEVRKADGWILPHEFGFKRTGDDWFLDEVYYNDGSGRYECL